MVRPAHLRSVRLPLAVIAIVFTATTATELSAARTVVLCHKPGTSAEKTLVLPSPAARAHLAHGDSAGRCPPSAEEGTVSARLGGLEEVPAVSTDARGRFSAEVTAEQRAIAYRLSYEGLEGEITQAHIHFGQRRVNGGVVAWLCANPAVVTDAPPGTPECSGTEGAIEGTLTSASIVGVAAQGIEPGEVSEVLRAVRAGATYANVHSMRFPSGEIRGQLH